MRTAIDTDSNDSPDANEAGTRTCGTHGDEQQQPVLHEQRLIGAVHLAAHSYALDTHARAHTNGGGGDARVVYKPPVKHTQPKESQTALMRANSHTR
jgi:hypothetical protein